MKIKEIPLQSQPRYRLEHFGVSSLSDSELLAVILQKGTREENVVDMCSRLLSIYDISRLSDMSLSELQKVKGIGPAKAMQIKALFEFNRRHYNSKKSNKKIDCAKDVYHHMHFLKEKKKEHLYGLFLDAKNYIIEKPELISMGILDASLIHPRELFIDAIRKSAKSVIIVHNHPSGDTKPSREDKDITEKLVESGRILEVKLLDHVIIGDGYFSFLENDLI